MPASRRLHAPRLASLPASPRLPAPCPQIWRDSEVSSANTVPTWLLAIGGAAITLGLATCESYLLVHYNTVLSALWGRGGMAVEGGLAVEHRAVLCSPAALPPAKHCGWWAAQLSQCARFAACAIPAVGHKVMQSMGVKMTRLTNSRGELRRRPCTGAGNSWQAPSHPALQQCCPLPFIVDRIPACVYLACPMHAVTVAHSQSA